MTDEGRTPDETREAEATPSHEGSASLWGELRERKVIRACAVYAAVAWGVVIGSADLTEILELPAVFPKVILVVAVLGFPVAAVLAWAYELTPDGVRRAPPLLQPGTGERSRLPFLAGLFVGALSVGFLASVLPLNGPPDPPTGPAAFEGDSSVVAIIPFLYNGPPDLDYLGHGIAPLLADQFTGAIGPRAADPAATASLWIAASTERPVDAARQVARELNAGRLISGAVFAGPDNRVTLSATLRDVARDEDLATAREEGSRDSLTTVAQRLANSLLSQSVGVSESLGQVSTAEPSALQAYLQGWSEFRQGRWGPDAYEHFARAVEIDSTFAVAWMWMADVAINFPSAPVSSLEALEHAWRHRSHLSERDQIYVEARLGPNYPHPSTRMARERAYLEAVRLNDDRASLWYVLGDNILHWPEGPDTYDRALGYFERALELEPNNGNALLHVELSHILRGDIQAALATAERMESLDSAGADARRARWIRALRDRDRGTVAALYDSLDGFGGIELYFADAPIYLVGPWQVEQLSRTLERIEGDLIVGSASDSDYLLLFYAHQDLGRPSRAMAALRRYEAMRDTVRLDMRVLNALFGALPQDVGHEAADSLEARLRRREEPLDVPLVLDRFVVELWRLAHDGEVGLDGGESMRRAAEMDHPPASRHLFEMLGLLLEGSVLAREGDPRARALIDRVDGVFRERMTNDMSSLLYDALVWATASAYMGLDDPGKALEVLEQESNFDGYHMPFNARFARERGRLAALTGDTARAVREYEFYLLMRSDPDPALAPERDGVRASLARLSGG